MKKLLLTLLLLCVIATSALAAPLPRSVTVASTANDETVYLAARGRQTGVEYPSAYVTIICTEACTVTFDPTSDVQGYYVGSIAAEWGGASHDHYVESGVPIVADEKHTFKVSAKTFTVSDVSVSGTMTVWVEYEE